MCNISIMINKQINEPNQGNHLINNSTNQHQSINHDWKKMNRHE